MKKTDKVFLVWVSEGENSSYWNQFVSIADAVDEYGDGCEVFECKPKLLGKFKNEIVLIPPAKKRRKRK